MKICVPTMGEKGLDELIGEHFGRVPTYTIVDLDTNAVKVIPNTSEHMGGVGYPPEIMVKEGPSRIYDLIDIGTKFTKKNGKLDLAKEGGHSMARIVHAKDFTGREIEAALLEPQGG